MAWPADPQRRHFPRRCGPFAPALSVLRWSHHGGSDVLSGAAGRRLLPAPPRRVCGLRGRAPAPARVGSRPLRTSTRATHVGLRPIDAPDLQPAICGRRRVTCGLRESNQDPYALHPSPCVQGPTGTDRHGPAVSTDGHRPPRQTRAPVLSRSPAALPGCRCPANPARGARPHRTTPTKAWAATGCPGALHARRDYLNWLVRRCSSES